MFIGGGLKTAAAECVGSRANSSSCSVCLGLRNEDVRAANRLGVGCGEPWILAIDLSKIGEPWIFPKIGNACILEDLGRRGSFKDLFMEP